jgi:hypothetical protein
MMRKAGWMMGSLLGVALVLGSVSPAQARPRYGYGHGGGWHHRDRGNGFGFGDAVGVAALIGAAAIVASSVSKNNKAARGDAPRDPAYDGDNRNNDGYDNSAPPSAAGTDYGADVASRDPAPGGTDLGDNAAVDACAVAARDEASGQGGYAEIRRINDPQAIEGGYNIDGEVENRASYRDTGGTTRRFTCTVKDGRVAEVYLSRDVVSR